MTNKRKSNTVLKISQSDLIDEITNDFAGLYPQEMVSDIIKDLESVILNHFKQTTNQQAILIKLFFGLQLSSKVVKKSEVTVGNKKYVRSERIKAHARYTPYFNRKVLNNL